MGYRYRVSCALNNGIVMVQHNDKDGVRDDSNEATLIESIEQCTNVLIPPLESCALN